MTSSAARVFSSHSSSTSSSCSRKSGDVFVSAKRRGEKISSSSSSSSSSRFDNNNNNINNKKKSALFVPKALNKCGEYDYEGEEHSHATTTKTIKTSLFTTSATTQNQTRGRKIRTNAFSGAHNNNMAAASSTENSSPLDKMEALIGAIWKFVRPHTIRGTLLGTTALVSKVLIENPELIQLSLFPRALLGLFALLCGNGFIVGINQIYDVEIDKVNKPYLPIGRVSCRYRWLGRFAWLQRLEAQPSSP